MLNQSQPRSLFGGLKRSSLAVSFRNGISLAVGVCASSYTLAVIAVERYYAICKPLQSRKWHTKVGISANVGSDKKCRYRKIQNIVVNSQRKQSVFERRRQSDTVSNGSATFLLS